jgi:hypothetical protein
MKGPDILSGLFWLGISIFVCVESIRADIGTFRSPGPGFLPFWSGVTLGTFAIIIAVKSILEKKGQGKMTDLWKGMEWDKVILVVTSLFIYAILLPKLGYLSMTFGLMVLLFAVIGKSKLWVQVMSAIITVLATYLIFYVWLEVQLPKGIFGL